MALAWTRRGRRAWRVVAGLAAGEGRPAIAAGWPRRMLPRDVPALGGRDLGRAFDGWVDVAHLPVGRDALGVALLRWLPYNAEHLRLSATELGRALRLGGQAFVVLTGRLAATLEPDWIDALVAAGLRVRDAAALRGPFSALSEALRSAALPGALVAPLRLADRWLAERVEPRFAADHFAWVERPAFTARRVHVGSGGVRLAGWLNVDRQALPGVDHTIDAAFGLGVAAGGADRVFAEHFLEHLEIDRALSFLREAHRALVPGGRLRLSTPNLAWVLDAQAPLAAPGPVGWAAACAWNRAFRGWEHRFLWSRSLLAEALLACGFDDLRWPAYGESEVADLRGLERHERYPDRPGEPHVLIVEARRAAAAPGRLQELERLLRTEVLDHRRG